MRMLYAHARGIIALDVHTLIVHALTLHIDRHNRVHKHHTCVSLVRMQVGFCSRASTVNECEDAIGLEGEYPDAAIARQFACCDSTDCNAKVVAHRPSPLLHSHATTSME